MAIGEEQWRKRKTGGPSPELTASIPSLLTWHWVHKFVTLANRKTLEVEDLYDMNPTEMTKHCEQQWMKAIQNERLHLGSHKMPSVLKLLWMCHGKELYKGAISKPFWLIAGVMQVYIVKELVKVAAKPKNLHWWWGTILVLGMFATSMIMTISKYLCMTNGYKVGMKIRSTVIMAVFNKLLSMRMVAWSLTNSGVMLNLVTNDTQKLLDAAAFLNFAWFAFVEILTVGALAVNEVGVSAVPGIFITLITQPLQMMLSRVVRWIRTKAIKYTDDRVRLVGEVVTGIKIVKYNGWTAIFLKWIEDLRNNEMHWIRKASFVRASTSTIKDSMTPLACLVTFGTYTIVHRGSFMPPSTAFTILALFNVLARTLNLAPTGFHSLAEASVAIQRLQKLLELPDGYGLSSQKTMSRIRHEHPDLALALFKCSFSWDLVEKNASKQLQIHPINHMAIRKSHTKVGPIYKAVPLGIEKNNDSQVASHGQTLLQEINLKIGKGELVAITGSVGSGKSSFLYGVLGEMQCLMGEYYILKDVAYASQQPWIFSDTIRRNIILESPFDPKRYHEIIVACALEYDISQFPGGHETEIGERGINLSGGQKARVSLARTCYSTAPLILLDDPLAAVDVQIANNLIKHVLKGILKGRTVILVTNNKKELDVCDRIIHFKDGRLHKEERKIFDLELQRAEDFIKTPPHLENMGTTNAATAMNFCEYNTGDEQKYMNFDNAIMRDLNNKNLHKSTLDSKYTEEKKDPPDHGDSIKDTEVLRGKLTVKEDRTEGNIALSVGLAYAKAGGRCFLFLVILVFLMGQVIRVMVDYWLRIWTERTYQLKEGIYVAGYASFAIGASLLFFLRALLFTQAANHAAIGLHNHMAKRVLRSPQVFFDQNFVGRILNRFSKDQAIVDEVLPSTALRMLELTFTCLGAVAIIGILVPWFLLCLPPFFIIFLLVEQRYASVSSDLKRLEGTSRSPLLSHFFQTLQGIVSVRAYGIQSYWHDQFISLIDANHQVFILLLHVTRWMNIRIEFAATICATILAIMVIILRHSLSPGVAGIIMVQSLQITGCIQFAVRQATETENHLTSVERIQAYAALPTEAAPHTAFGIIPESWPFKGEIEYRNYTMAYRQELPPVLNNISFKVNAAEKIGIVGRTGVGKSSLAAALFRMVENGSCGGDIFIDSINIKLVGLDDLRQRLTIIPQDPILFRGTLRWNLDPFERHSDQEIFEVLSVVQLTKKIQSLDKGLDSSIADNGDNFSVGQKQLLCLARSLLRRSQILVMDEATASVDRETDKVIQATISEAFHHSTVLIIAHRIETVIGCDRILTLAQGGCIAEYDSPINLLRRAGEGEDGGGLFATMVADTGPAMAEALCEAATTAEEVRRRRQQHTEEEEEEDSQNQECP